jgi:transposase
VLEAAEGHGTREIARELETTPTTVSLWRIRYAREGLDGLEDRLRSGTPPIYGEVTDQRIRKVLDQPPPKGFARWNGPLIARALGDVDVQYVWRSLRKQKIDLAGRKSWCESNDPDFAAKAADVVGLYMAPPKNAIVLCVDEKPSIQALERAQGYLKLPNGRAMTGHSHDYKRHGTTTLFAAFEVATGKVRAAHRSCWRPIPTSRAGTRKPATTCGRRSCSREVMLPHRRLPPAARCLPAWPIAACLPSRPRARAT